jgi:hypothetical protein
MRQAQEPTSPTASIIAPSHANSTKPEAVPEHDEDMGKWRVDAINGGEDADLGCAQARRIP